MKRKVYTIMLALLLVSVIGASIVGAEIKSAETGPYDPIEGKKLLFYGDIIEKVKIHWGDPSNISNYSEKTINLTSGATTYLYSLTNKWNATIIQWFAIVTDTSDVNYTFTGAFLTTETEIDYSKISSYVSTLKSDIISWLLTNKTYSGRFTGIETNLTKSIGNLISTYNTGLITQFKLIGLTDTQISQIQDSVTEGFADTLREQEKQDAAVEEARTQGWWDGVIIAIGAVIAVLIIVSIVMYFRGGLPTLKRRKKQDNKAGLNLDIFNLEE
jgi:hypothetical protein